MGKIKTDFKPFLNLKCQMYVISSCICLTKRNVKRQLISGIFKIYFMIILSSSYHWLESKVFLVALEL